MKRFDRTERIGNQHKQKASGDRNKQPTLKRLRLGHDVDIRN